MVETLADCRRLNQAPINVNNEYELRYWCEKFECTPARLRLAVMKVGAIIANVRRELQKR